MGRRSRARHRAERDEGVSLVETLVAMTVFTVLMAVVLSAVVSMSRSAVASQSTADTAAGIRKAFTTMDKQVRYADAINAPGLAGGSYWVEFRVPAVLAGDAVTCRQWRYTPTTGVLAQRSWVEGTAPAATWSVLVRSVTTAASPFTLRRAGLTSASQGLDLSLTAATTTGGVPSQVQTAFVARNSTAESPGNADANADGVSDAPVCSRDANRS